MSGSARFYGILVKVLVKTLLFPIIMDVKTIGRLDLKKVPRHKRNAENPAKTPSEVQTKATCLGLCEGLTSGKA